MYRKVRGWKDKVAEPARVLSAYREWAEPYFADDSLYLTVCLLRAEDAYGLVESCFKFVEQKVLLRRPGRILRLPVRVHEDGFPHMHALVKNVPYTSKNCESFEQLLVWAFRNRLPTPGDVLVQRISGGAGVPLLYSLEQQGGQGDVEVMLEALYLPPAGSKF